MKQLRSTTMANGDVTIQERKEAAENPMSGEQHHAYIKNWCCALDLSIGKCM